MSPSPRAHLAHRPGLGSDATKWPRRNPNLPLPPPRRAYPPSRSCGRVAEGGGLLKGCETYRPVAHDTTTCDFIDVFDTRRSSLSRLISANTKQFGGNPGGNWQANRRPRKRPILNACSGNANTTHDPRRCRRSGGYIIPSGRASRPQSHMRLLGQHGRWDVVPMTDN